MKKEDKYPFFNDLRKLNPSALAAIWLLIE